MEKEIKTPEEKPAEKKEKPEYKKPEYIMIHHTAISYDRNPDQFKATNSYHEAQWGLRSSLGFYVGYNYEINKSGRANKAREDGENTAACYQKDMNDGRCLHIALDGNFDIEKPAPAQIYKLRDLLKEKVKEYGIDKDNIVFHRDYSATSCPGKNLDIIFVRSLVSPNAFKAELKPKEKALKVVEYLLNLIKTM